MCTRCRKNDVMEGRYICDACYLESIRWRVKQNTSYSGCFQDIKWLLEKYDQDREKLKRQDNEVIISYALERQKLIDGLREYANGLLDPKLARKLVGEDEQIGNPTKIQR